MKKQKLLSMMMLIVMIIPLMVGCGSDDDGGSGATGSDLINKAIGTWMCTQSTDTGQGQTYQGVMVGKEVTINANGTYTSTSLSIGYTGTYTVSGNRITAKSNNGETFVFTVSISGDRMVWDGTASNGVTFNYVFVREGASQQTAISVTKEMISGTAWTVKNFNIERGSNNSVQIGKTVIFKTDGSFEGFNSMETAWRINNGRIETYYAPTNEPMYVYTLLSQSGDNVTIRMNGTLDDELQATLYLEKILYTENTNTTAEETFFSNKEQVLSIRDRCYLLCEAFVDAQLKLEKIRTNSGTVHNITPSSDEVKNAWESAYTAIQHANILIGYKDSFSGLFSTQEYNELLAEARFIRAFIYYNLTETWGDVPWITSASIAPETSYTPRANRLTILNNYLMEISEEIQNLSSQNDRLRVSRDAGLMLKAEIEMSIGDGSKAIATLNQINSNNYIATRSTSTKLEQFFIWALSQSSQTNVYYPVYTLMHHQLYLYETTGSADGLMLPILDINSDGVPDDVSIEKYWLQSNYLDYGYWAALKRMGKAQTVTGCYDYELLMPIPASEIMFNPALTQNPGY